MSVSINRLLATGGSLVLFAASCFVSLPGTARADDFHYVNILVGDRAADMAGAYTAVSDNASGCYYNPAGIVYGAGSNLSASVNAFSIANKTYRGALPLVSGKRENWTQTSTVLLPNYFGATYDTRFGTLGFSYAVPDSVQRRQKQTFTDVKSITGAKISNYMININDVDNTYVFGPSYAVKLGDSFALGATLYGTYRDATVIRNQYVHLADTDPNDANDYSTGFEWRNGYVYRKEIGLKPIIGMMWSPSDKLVIGLTASKPYLLSSDHDSQLIRNTNIDSSSDPAIIDPALPNNPTINLVSDAAERKLPLEAKLGVAYFASPALLLSADLSYHAGTGTLVRDEQTQRFVDGDGDGIIDSVAVLEDQVKPVINLALGAEYYFSDRYALRGGVYTDFANSDKLSKDGQTMNQPEHVDLYGATLSLTRFTRSTSTTVGLGYAFGEGDAQIVGGSVKTQTIEVSNLVAFLSAAYSF